MINLLLGAPGGGKSYEATAFHVIPAIEAGRKVITNLPLVMEHFHAIFPQSKDLLVVRKESSAKGKLPFAVLADWLDDWRHPETGVGPLIIVDECHQVLPRSGTDQAIVEHAALHRHTGADWLLMTQDHGKINKDIKALIQLSYVVRKNIALGTTKEYTRSVYDGLKTSGTGNRVSQLTRTYLPQYFKFYKSHTLSNVAVLEEGAKDVTPFFIKFRNAGIVMTLCGPLLIGGWYWYKHETKPQVEAPKAHVVAGKQPVPVAVAAARRNVGQGTASVSVGEPPLGDLTVRLLGSIGNSKRSVWYFSIERDGQTQFQLTGADMYKAGYRIEEVTDCVVKVDHPDIPKPFFVRCGNTFQAVNSLRTATESAMPPSVNAATSKVEAVTS